MAEEDLNSDFESNLDAVTIAETKSAVLLSALFVLRKLAFNQKRYSLDEQLDHNENLTKFVNEFKHTFRLFEWSLYGEELGSSQLEQYVFKVQLHEILYKIHHTILSIMPSKVEDHIEQIDFLIKEFSSESSIDMESLRVTIADLMSWLNDLIETDSLRT